MHLSLYCISLSFAVAVSCLRYAVTIAIATVVATLAVFVANIAVGTTALLPAAATECVVHMASCLVVRRPFAVVERASLCERSRSPLEEAAK